MRPVIVKAYGNLHPTTEEAFIAVQTVLNDWFIPYAAEFSNDIIRISYEGEFFPDSDVVEAIKPFLHNNSQGKLDILDLEAWTLHRYFFDQGKLRDHTATLDKALEACSMH